MAVLHLIISNDKDLPSTFEYDFDRLSALQVHFQSYLMVAGCCQIFAKTLQLLGQGKAPSPELYHSLVNCIRALAPCLGSTSNDDREQRIQDVALEIVREAYSVCNIQSLPDSTLVKGIEGWVRIWWHSKSIAYENLEKTYRKELWDLLMENVDTVMKMTPLQMLDWLNPPPSKREPKTEGISMSSMARRLAHIAILHWRIWAPILYQQPWDSHMDPLIVDPNSVERQVDLTSPSVVQSPENGPRKSLQWSSEEDRGDEV